MKKIFYARTPIRLTSAFALLRRDKSAVASLWRDESAFTPLGRDGSTRQVRLHCALVGEGVAHGGLEP